MSLLLENGADPTLTDNVSIRLVVHRTKRIFQPPKLLVAMLTIPKTLSYICIPQFQIYLFAVHCIYIHRLSFTRRLVEILVICEQNGVTAPAQARRYNTQEKAVVKYALAWWRVKNFVVFLHTGACSSVSLLFISNGNCLLNIPGDFSSSDWSIRLWSKAESIIATSSTGSSAHTGGSVARSCGGAARRRQSSVLNNRDLCRILCSYIPGPNTEQFDDGNSSIDDEEAEVEEENN